MHRKVIILIILMVITSYIYAQTKAFQFGFKLAPNIGWIKPDATDYERTGTKLGFNWGFTGEVYLMENYGLNTGFNVIYLNGAYKYPHLMKLSDDDPAEIEGELERDLRTQYLQIPLILKMKTNDFGGYRVYGQVGFGLGFLLRAKADEMFLPTSGSIREEEKIDVKKELRGTRESLIIGAGIEIPIGGSTFITAGLLFDNNFIDILKDQNKLNPSVENNGISNFLEFKVGLMF